LDKTGQMDCIDIPSLGQMINKQEK